MYNCLIHIWLTIILTTLKFTDTNSTHNVRNNVCKTYGAYHNKQNSKDCFFNPDMFDNMETIVKRHGYPIETYYVTTTDGYILRVFRIPHGKGNNNSTSVKRSPILLMHAWLSNSVQWVYMGDDSLAFSLANAGFDVWLGNSRGSYYSNQHVNLTTESPGKYWEFSYEEHGIYDCPAMLDLVYSRTGKSEKVVIIGYSMSATVSLVYASLLQMHSLQTVKAIIAMGPTTNFKHGSNIIDLLLPLAKLIQPITTFVGHYTTDKRLIPHGKFQTEFVNNICLASSFLMKLCVRALVGFDWSYIVDIKPELLPIIFTQTELPGFSLKLFYHYYHQWRDRSFHMYDYGKLWNRQHYNSSKVPLYPIENIEVPVHAMVAPIDYLASPGSVEQLYSRMGKEAKKYGYYVVPLNKFAHIDFLMSKDVKQYVHKHIIEFIRSI